MPLSPHILNKTKCTTPIASAIIFDPPCHSKTGFSRWSLLTFDLRPEILSQLTPGWNLPCRKHSPVQGSVDVHDQADISWLCNSDLLLSNVYRIIAIHVFRGSNNTVQFVLPCENHDIFPIPQQHAAFHVWFSTFDAKIGVVNHLSVNQI